MQSKHLPPTSDLMRELLAAVVAFVVRAGFGRAEIEAMLKDCMAWNFTSDGRPVKNWRRKVAIGCDTVAGAVLRAWHRDAAFISEHAKPLPLPIGGAGPSLASLIRSQYKNADVLDVLAAMKASGLIRKSGARKYLPTRDAATITQLNVLAVDHIAKTVMRLVETATRNTQRSDGGARLIERYAHVPNLASRESRAFAAFSAAQGQACLDTMEDWLETRRVRGSAGKAKGGVSAGVHIFAFLDDARKGRANVGGSVGKAKKPSTPASPRRAARA